MSIDGPSLADLEAAQADLEAAEQAWENYRGNNPNKHHTRIGAARQRVRALTRALKASGDLPRTAHEQLEADLDALYPDARSKQIVTYEGIRYERRFTPARLSLSAKTVLDWDRGWARMPDS